MMRSEGYWFMRLGSMIERGDSTARLLDVKYYLLLPQGQAVGGKLDRDQWTTILDIVSAKTAFRHLYRQGLRPWLVADMLIFRRELPRSLIWTAEQTVDLLGEFGGRSGRQGPADRLARQRLAGLEELDVRTVFRGGLHQWLHAYLRQNNALGEAIAASSGLARVRLMQLSISHVTRYEYPGSGPRGDPAPPQDAAQLRRPDRARLADRRRLRREASRGPRRLRQRHPHALRRQALPASRNLGHGPVLNEDRAGVVQGLPAICRRRSIAGPRRSRPQGPLSPPSPNPFRRARISRSAGFTA